VLFLAAKVDFASAEKRQSEKINKFSVRLILAEAPSIFAAEFQRKRL
jgi:hypothetical protein